VALSKAAKKYDVSMLVVVVDMTLSSNSEVPTKEKQPLNQN